MSNLDNVVNGIARIHDQQFFVTDYDACVRAARMFYQEHEDLIATVDEIGIGSNISDLDVATFPRIVGFYIEQPCYADGCRNAGEDKPYVELNYSFSLLETIDLTAQFTLRGYS